MHRFHFIMDEETFDTLSVICRKRKGKKKSLAWVLKIIFEDFFTHINKYNSIGKLQNRQYKLIHPNKALPRKDIHFFMEETVYNRMREIRHQLNFFTIAQLVRAIIAEYLEAYGKNGQFSGASKSGISWFCLGSRGNCFFIIQKDFFRCISSWVHMSPVDLKNYIAI